MFSFDNETLLRKALQLFLIYGYRKTTMGDLAVVMAVSRQTLYSRFSSKEKLFKVLIEAILRQAFERGQLELVSDRPAWQAVAVAFDKWLGASIEELAVTTHGMDIYKAWRAQRTSNGRDALYAFQMRAALSEFLRRAEALGEIELKRAGFTPGGLSRSLVDCADGIRATSGSSAEFQKKMESMLLVFDRATENLV